MVRKSILVYELLRTEQPQQGFSEKEIVDQISHRHDIVAGKGLRRQVAVALRRGLDFGILAKKNNRFRFDPDSAIVNNARRQVSSRKSKPRKKRNERKSRNTNQRTNSSGNKNQNRKRQTVPPAPLPKSWRPDRRNLPKEPIPKVKKI